MAYAFAAVNQSVCDELVLIDLNEVKSRADVTDLNHGEAWAPSPVTVTFGTYAECANAAMVVICAGIAQRPGRPGSSSSRRISGSSKGHRRTGHNHRVRRDHPVATNPVDVLAYATWVFSGLPSAQVIGSGTALDATARLRFNLGQYFEVSTTNVPRHGHRRARRLRAAGLVRRLDRGTLAGQATGRPAH